MKIASLHRDETGPEGTFGTLVFDNRLTLFTAELPWKENQRQVSCIPEGRYMVYPRWSEKYGHHLKVAAVPDRTMILIHAGNFAGDESLGHKSDSSGCILVGRDRGKIENQEAVLSSRKALEQLVLAAEGEPFSIEIYGACG